MGKLQFVRQATPETAPNTLKFRYLSEDVPYGLVPIASLGNLAGVETLITKAIIMLASVINKTNYWQEGLTVEKLGFDGLSPREIFGLLS
jgi:opine dehydrogenase